MRKAPTNQPTLSSRNGLRIADHSEAASRNRCIELGICSSSSPKLATARLSCGSRRLGVHDAGAGMTCHCQARATAVVPHGSASRCGLAVTAGGCGKRLSAARVHAAIRPSPVATFAFPGAIASGLFQIPFGLVQVGTGCRRRKPFLDRPSWQDIRRCVISPSTSLGHVPRGDLPRPLPIAFLQLAVRLLPTGTPPREPADPVADTLDAALRGRHRLQPCRVESLEWLHRPVGTPPRRNRLSRSFRTRSYRSA